MGSKILPPNSRPMPGMSAAMGRVSRPSSRVRIGGVWITPCLTTVRAVAGAVGATSALAAAARTSALFIVFRCLRGAKNRRMMRAAVVGVARAGGRVLLSIRAAPRAAEIRARRSTTPAEQEQPAKAISRRSTVHRQASSTRCTLDLA